MGLQPPAIEESSVGAFEIGDKHRASIDPNEGMLPGNTFFAGAHWGKIDRFRGCVRGDTTPKQDGRATLDCALIGLLFRVEGNGMEGTTAHAGFDPRLDTGLTTNLEATGQHVIGLKRAANLAKQLAFPNR